MAGFPNYDGDYHFTKGSHVPATLFISAAFPRHQPVVTLQVHSGKGVSVGRHVESSGSKSNSPPVWLHGVASLKEPREGQGTDAEPKSWPSVWEAPNGRRLSGAGNAPTGPVTSLLGPADPGFCPHPTRPVMRWLGSRATALPYTLLPAVDASRSPHWLWGCSGGR